DAVEAATFDVPEINGELLAAVDEFLSNIPEGYYSLGTVEKMQGAMDTGATVIDVREESEYTDGHIAGAIDIPIRTIAQNLDQIPTDQTVVVYCASGFRAAMSTAALHIMGYDNVRAFPPSYAGWADAGGATE
ncbi:MAG TPA: rhodanese-like domain-containing protein, partial [Caldilineaceae bacterium]|nr:rhodanese-like domain-containing protein [Caldilineaceae bacterium]